MLLLPKFIAGFSGEFVDAFGWANFFTGTAMIGVPVLVLVWLAGRGIRATSNPEQGGQEDRRTEG
jgi:PAT family beta-lactamase induction signal transducer AmpG